MSLAARRRVRDQFSLHRSHSQYDDLINALVTHRGIRNRDSQCIPVPVTWRNRLRLGACFLRSSFRHVTAP
jgi:hypothetical protein